jgi:hypothetical protein
MQEVKANCYDSISEECSKDAHSVIGYSWDDTVECVSDSFSGTNISTSNNDVLAYMKKQW